MRRPTRMMAFPPEVPTEGLAVPALPEGNFAWLHQQAFAPTCANSGCHDGTFEPDFRTVGASWNTRSTTPSSPTMLR